jgi:hypothetical protein
MGRGRENDPSCLRVFRAEREGPGWEARLELPEIVGSDENDDDDAGSTFSRDIAASAKLRAG